MFPRATPDPESYGPLGALRRFVRSPQAAVPLERCELCTVPLAAEHQHLIDPANRRLVCACDACAVLFDRPSGAALRRVPRTGRRLANFQLPDEVWDDLSLPISLAFFFFSSPANRIVALYPSPAGPTESLLPLAAWQALVERNPVLAALEPDVEALLVNRLGARRGFSSDNYYLAPIDACYELVGRIRMQWRGLGGGTEVWEEITRFMTQLGDRCRLDESLPAALTDAPTHAPPDAPHAIPGAVHA